MDHTFKSSFVYVWSEPGNVPELIIGPTFRWYFFTRCLTLLTQLDLSSTTVTDLNWYNTHTQGCVIYVDLILRILVRLGLTHTYRDASSV